MPGIETNRDLYLAALAFEKRARRTDRSLETFLLALWDLARPLRKQPSIPVETFVRLLDEALTAPAPSFRESWRDLPDEVGQNEPPGPGKWEATMIRQIRDLREMDEAGTPTGVHGMVAAPRGSPFYNSDPGSFVVAGVAYHFGGWARVGEELRAEDVFPVHEITWHDFTEFLLEGQWND
jgi:hypothetical protein